MNTKEKVILALCSILCIILLATLIAYGAKRQLWLDSHCSKIGTVSASVGIVSTISSNGTIGTGNAYIPGKTGYKCDDGIEYWE